MDKNDIVALAKKAQCGDKTAFEMLYNELRDKVYFFVKRNVNNTELAEDITSETFITAFEQISQLRSEESFVGWIYAIAYNKCMVSLKDEQHIAHFENNENKENVIDCSILNEAIMLPDDYAVNVDTKRQLSEIIDNLTPDQRSAVILYYYDELSISEVANSLGTNENNIRQKLFKARKRIKKQIEKLIGNGAMFMAVPLSSILENTADESYKIAKDKVRKGIGKGVASKITAICAAAVVTIGVPVALSKLTNKGDYQPDNLSEDSNVVRWAVPETFEIIPENLTALNEKLKEDGYNFTVEFIKVTNDASDNTIYYNELHNLDDIDIAFSGYGSDYGTDISGDLIREGFFAKLSELKSGNTLYDAYSEKQWNQTRIDGKIYTIPNANITNNGISFIFNKNYFSDKQISDFDLNFCSLDDMLKNAGVEGTGNDIILDTGVSKLLESNGSVYKNGILLSASTGKAEPLFYSNEMESLLYTLHSLSENNFISHEMTLTSVFNEEKFYTPLKSGDFKVYITADIERLELEGIEIGAPYTIRTTKPYIQTRLAGSTGIVADSNNKQSALKLLELIYTDSEYLKYLVYDAPLTSEECQLSFANQIIIGSNNTNNNLEKNKKFYDEQTIESPFIGKAFDFSKTKVDITSLVTQTNFLLDIWREQEFDEAFISAQIVLDDAGANKLAQQINKQLS